MTAQASSALYKPLPGARALRLVVLEPGQPEDRAVVCRLLQLSDIQPILQYEALSYVWGKGMTNDLTLNGTIFPATVNLVSALRHLRYPEGYRVLWIDAICINQSDIPERNKQVGRMADIYRNAQRTLVWLGEWDSRNELATSHSIQEFLERAIELSRAEEMTYDNIIKQNDGLGCFLEVCYLLESEWFKRVWVLQEAAVAFEVLFVCGQITLSWNHLIDGWSAIGNMPDAPHVFLIHRRWFELRIGAVTFCRRYLQDPEWQRDFARATLQDRILSLLLLSNGQAATDERDRLYALISIAGSVEEIRREPNLAVNYDAEPEVVLGRLAVYLLRSTKDISLFYGASYRTSLDVPSWMPVWQGNRHRNLARYFDPRTPLFRLKTDTEAQIDFSRDEKSIEVKGHLVGHITDVGRPADVISDEREDTKSLFLEWEAQILQPLADGLPKACLRAVVGEKADSVPDFDWGIDAPGIWSQTLFHAKAWDEEENEENALEWLLYSALMDDEEADQEFLTNFGLTLDMFCTMEAQRLHGGAPFAMSSGLVGFFGDASLLQTHPDASICLFQGCRVPFVLAGGPQKYKLLGPCYIQPYITMTTTFGYPDLITLV